MEKKMENEMETGVILGLYLTVTRAVDSCPRASWLILCKCIVAVALPAGS